MTYEEFITNYPGLKPEKIKLNFVSMYKHNMTYAGQFRYKGDVLNIEVIMFAEYRADMYAEETLSSLYLENSELNITVDGKE